MCIDGSDSVSSTKQILTNTLTGWLAIVVQSGVAFLMVPFLLSRLGKDGYGLLGILSVLVGLSQVADLGLRGALGRELTEKVSANDHKGFNELTNTALLLYIGIASLLALVLIALSPWLVVLFKVPEELVGSAARLIRFYGAGSILLSFITPVFTAVLSSHHRFDLINSVQIAVSTCFSLIIFLAVSVASNRLAAWAMVMLINQVVILALTYHFAKKTANTLTIGWQYRNFSHLQPLFKLGGYMYAFQLSQMLSQSSDPLVITSFFGPAGVALYQPGTRLSQVARPIVTTLSNQLYPLTTKQHVRKDQEKMQQLLVLGTKYTLLMAALAVVGMITCAYPLCKLWISDSVGDDYQIVAMVLIGWALADFMAYTAGSQSAVLLGTKKLKFLMWTMLPMSILNLALSIYLVGFTTLGIPGVLVATILTGLLRRPLIVWYTAHVCGMKTRDYFLQAYASSFVVMALIGAFAAGVCWFWTPATWAGLIFFAGGITFLWGVLVWLIGFNSADRQRVRELLKELFPRRLFSCKNK